MLLSAQKLIRNSIYLRVIIERNLNWKEYIRKLNNVMCITLRNFICGAIMSGMVAGVAFVQVGLLTIQYYSLICIAQKENIMFHSLLKQMSTFSSNF